MVYAVVTLAVALALVLFYTHLHTISLLGMLEAERKQHREEMTGVLSRKGEYIAPAPVSFQPAQYKYVFDEEGLDYMVVPADQPEDTESN